MGMLEPTDEGKKRLRQEVLKRRNALSPEKRRIASLKMTDRLMGHQWFYGAKKLLLFASYGSEIDTAELIREALAKAKEVYLPRVEGQDLQFYRIAALEELKAGYRGIPEPEGNTQLYRYQEDDCKRTLLIMPGVAFDPYRNRIGYGKGFYDRYLTGKPKLAEHSIAIGFACQMVEEIPADPQDIKPYQVLVF